MNTKPADELLARLRENFDLATQGAPGPWTRMTELPKVTSAGIDCNPAQLNRRNASLQLVLPSRREDRYAVLAAIVPDGGLRIIYIAYGDDTDPEDLIIPSKSLDWESAKEHNNFRLDVRSFDALFSGTNESMPLFRQAGVYQFALLNSLDRELLAVNQHEFEVKAGCVVHWTP